MNIACRSTQNVARIKRFSRLHIVIEPLNKKNNILNSLLCWSVTLLMFIYTLDRLSKVRTGWRIGDFGNFWTVSLKANDWSSWILTECNLSWKTVKDCILSEVCMINTAPHSTVSPQMWCIKSIKGWFTHLQICWQDFVK